ncbi:hypothetical protein SAMN04487895_101622 [Paenibacillus sophorae]|uniref:Uncharacterized protein n=1 Tax=Paenibacillus sophorae TaxID=1333845 RepID=A0A1H8GTX2_9BACL|nr:hypothetical protein [Paenibacillus sophorae]QWU14319.1 hypothetical protein KP014_20650 [Paenibacillus sophorae]SEN46708.1 hypothetical protein SAMN04487895_101622 [Paenibacillus sophorae]
MKNYFKNNWFLFFLAIPFIVFSILYPNVTVEMSGGFAWAYFWILTCVGGSLVWCGLFGGEISYSSKGLVGWINGWKGKDKNE